MLFAEDRRIGTDVPPQGRPARRQLEPGARGNVEIVRPGEYTITAGPELEDAVAPQILVGG